MTHPDRTPVLVGIGTATQREEGIFLHGVFVNLVLARIKELGRAFSCKLKAGFGQVTR